jgi:hypothetical protein
MEQEIDQHRQTIIADEVLRSRVRELTGKPGGKPPSTLSRVSTNPMASLLVGFVLTGLVGSSLTYYYTERQKENEAARQLHEQSLEAQRKKEGEDLEYLRKQGLLELENKQHLNAQALEAQRTKEMRASEARRTQQEKDIDYARSQINVVESRKIEQARLLELFVKYVNSEDPSQRAFGYEMFVYFGHGDLAAKIISEKADPAGRSTLIDLRANASASQPTQDLVSKALLKISDVQLKRILTVVNIFSTGRADAKVGNSMLPYLGPHPELLATYMASPEAKYRERLRPYLNRIQDNDEALYDDTAYHALLKDLENDSVMTDLLDKLFRRAYVNPAIEYADQNGVNTVLGLAAFVDTAVQHGLGGMKRYADEASASLNGSPRNGVDEKVWVAKFIDVRLGRIDKAFSRLPEAVKVAVRKRVSFFRDQAERNNWDLLPPFEVNGQTFAAAP